MYILSYWQVYHITLHESHTKLYVKSIKNVCMSYKIAAYPTKRYVCPINLYVKSTKMHVCHIKLHVYPTKWL